MIPRFHTRLTAAGRDGNLTVTDLAQWFGVKRATMSLWALGKAAPHQAKEKQLMWALLRLEEKIEDGEDFPIPLTVSRSQRADYINSVKVRVHNTVSKSGPAAKRRQGVVRPKG